MRIAMAQYNPIIGDLRGNLARLLAAAANARELGASLLVCPELALSGYPPRDFLDRPGFVQDCLHALAQLVSHAPMPVLVGSVVGAGTDPLHASGRISNGAVLVENGKITACHRKNLLPNYDVFDEARYFTPGQGGTLAIIDGVKLGISICEDIWNDAEYWPTRRYDRDPLAEEVAQGAQFLINLSASPYHAQKFEQRVAMLQASVRRHGCALLYVNQVGGNDSLIFDGRSVALDGQGQITMRGAAYKEQLLLAKLEGGSLWGELQAEPSCLEEDVMEALCLGLHDYVRKSRFEKVMLGLSGGIDSALCATLAVRALGASKVLGVAMPSRYSSPGSVTDALALAQRLGIRCDQIPIEPLVESFDAALKQPFAGLAADVTEENLQSRIRGTLLMAYSNKLGALLLNTGNKSEVAMGYCTLYGDMNGGLSPLSDLYKTQVYDLARFFNRTAKSPPIPENSITKPPSAELRPDQTDQDTLPPYAELDAILNLFLEEQRTVSEIVARGFKMATVQKIVATVERSEYKRRQMAPGLRVSRKAFGEGRRIPLAHRYAG